MKAFVREHLKKRGEIPPLMNSTGLIIYDPEIFSKEFESLQPDAWNSYEFNLLLVAKNGELYREISIDFDFKE